MSMLRAVAWGMVDLAEIKDAKRRVDIKRMVNMELQPYLLWISACASYHDQSVRNFKISHIQGKPETLEINTYQNCCRYALQYITQRGNNATNQR